MIILPVKGDKITTKDGAEFIVSSYTNLKPEPAVYIKVAPNENNLVYFQDIEKINGADVQFAKGNKTFTALGPVKRKFDLPQPKSTITVSMHDKMTGTDSVEDVVVKTLKLHNRSEGVSKGLLICGEDECYPISRIVNMDSGLNFDAKRFMKYYEDYFPFKFDRQ